MRVKGNIQNNEPSVTIRKIKFNNNIEINLEKDDIIIFVGANNVGKSRALKDIKDDLTDSARQKIIIKDIEYNRINFKEENIKNFFETNLRFYKGENGMYSYDIPGEHNVTIGYNEYDFNNISNSNNKLNAVFFTFLSTENRLNITAPISCNYVQDNFSLNIMEELASNKDELKKLNGILLDVFEKAIDVSENHVQHTYIKMYKIGSRDEIAKTMEADRRSAKKILEELEELNNQGDGIRSAVAILASLIVNKQSIYLIDEPETFLHPPQARLLGSNLVDLSIKKQCFITTHNIDLIRGIFEKNSQRVKVIKIDRKSNENNFYVLDNESIKQIANDRNLKYTNILNGLFYDKVVLCENESDCKFYSVILEALNSKIHQNILFCAVGGKDQFKVIIPILKKLAINYLVIADIDLINDINKLRQLVNSVEKDKYREIAKIHKEFLDDYEKNIDGLIKKQTDIKVEIESFFTEDTYMPQDVADKIKSTLKNINRLKLLKSGGIAVIPQGNCITKFKQIEKMLNDNNIFILECGEIERFIPEINKHGAAWVDAVFEAYPDINNPIYNTVKEFIRKVFKIVEKDDKNE